MINDITLDQAKEMVKNFISIGKENLDEEQKKLLKALKKKIKNAESQQDAADVSDVSDAADAEVEVLDTQEEDTKVERVEYIVLENVLCGGQNFKKGDIITGQNGALGQLIKDGLAKDYQVWMKEQKA